MAENEVVKTSELPIEHAGRVKVVHGAGRWVQQSGEAIQDTDDVELVNTTNVSADKA